MFDLPETVLHNRPMFRARQRWIAIACLAAWALGPAIGIGLAAHELEHHGAEPRDHSHAAQAAEAFLHGHVHEDDVDDHVHDLAPPSFTLSRLGKQLQSQQAAVAPAGSPARPASLSQADGPPPEPSALVKRKYGPVYRPTGVYRSIVSVAGTIVGGVCAVLVVTGAGALWRIAAAARRDDEP